MKKALYPILFFALLYVAAFIADKYFANKYSQNTALNSNWVWQTEGKTFDYAVMGSSRVKAGIYVHKLDSLLNKNGLNIGDHGIGIAEQYVLVNKFLTTNKCKYLVLQVDYAEQNSEDFIYPVHYYNYFPYIGDSAVSTVFKDNIGWAKFLFWKYVPMFKYAEFNSEYIRELFWHKTEQKTNSKGDVLIKVDDTAAKQTQSNTAKTDKPRKNKDKQYFGNFYYNKTDSVYLHKILTVAKNTGTKVILFTSPESVSDTSFANTVLPDMVKYYQAIGAKYNTPYFHFFGSAFSADRSNISGDGLHLTPESVKVFTPMMADSLKKYMQ